jgi:DNA topoisomerase-1
LGWSVSDTMRMAQQLYEAGHISYMRTDSTHLSAESQAALSALVQNKYGPAQLGSGASPKTKKKSKNAQEAHEAIRPALLEGGRFTTPALLEGQLPAQAVALYDLIYRRTVASFMIPQKVNFTTVHVEAQQGDTTARFKTTGRVVIDPGFTQEWGPATEDTMLPSNLLIEGDSVECDSVEAISHDTQPPPRFTEASFVKQLEALGVGRPSTYASVVATLRNRGYVGSPIKADESSSQPKNAVTGPAISAQRAAGGAGTSSHPSSI